MAPIRRLALSTESLIAEGNCVPFHASFEVRFTYFCLHFHLPLITGRADPSLLVLWSFHSCSSPCIETVDEFGSCTEW